MTKKETFWHQCNFCECVINWLSEKDMTLLSFYDLPRKAQERFYKEFLTAKKNRVVCFDSPEARAIREFTQECGKWSAKARYLIDIKEGFSYF